MKIIARRRAAGSALLAACLLAADGFAAIRSDHHAPKKKTTPPVIPAQAYRSSDSNDLLIDFKYPKGWKVEATSGEIDVFLNQKYYDPDDLKSPWAIVSITHLMKPASEDTSLLAYGDVSLASLVKDKACLNSDKPLMVGGSCGKVVSSKMIVSGGPAVLFEEAPGGIPRSDKTTKTWYILFEAQGEKFAIAMHAFTDDFKGLIPYFSVITDSLTVRPKSGS